MCNRLYKLLSKSKIICPKQFGFQKDHSTDLGLLQFVDQIYESFERNEYRIGVFIDLSKASGTVDHNILLKKIRNLRHIWHASSVVPKLLKQQETVYSVSWLARKKLQTCEVQCSTRIHFRTYPFSSVYQ